jgi:hypothetical protein
MRTIVDVLGIRHRLERGAERNTRCGRLVAGDVGHEEDVDCMACVGGPSLLSLRDLRVGVEVVAWVQLFDDQGNQAGDSAQVTFTNGENVHEISFTGLAPGTVLVGHRYHDEDGRTIWINKWASPLVVREDLEIGVEAGRAKIV